MSLSTFAVLRVSVAGLASPGSISVPGLKVGDTVIRALDVTTQGMLTSGGLFELTVSVDDELQQLGGSTDTYDFIFLRGV